MKKTLPALCVLSAIACGSAHGADTMVRALPVLPNVVVDVETSVARNLPHANQVNEDKLRVLATQVAWQRLLFMRDGVSTLDNPKFFLSEQGYNDAYAELVATYQAMMTGDKSVCRFPARVMWLADKLGLTADFSSCDELNAWLSAHNAQKLSLVFSEENPNVLGSAFAHVLIKADTAQSMMSGDDKDAFAINYTVARQKDDGEAAASVKSVVGGYAGVMEFFDYADKRDVYLVEDKRDMWEYGLDLTTDEVAQIMRHIWEVKDMARAYYFTHDNCATEILRLIDVVRPDENLQAKSGKITIPSEITRLLVAENVATTRHYLPSVASKAQAVLNAKAHAVPINHDVTSHDITRYDDPSMASPVHRFGAGGGVSNDRAYSSIAIRSAYHDVLDRQLGVRQYLDVSMLSADVKIDKDKLKINDLTVFSTRSYNPINSAKNNATDDKAATAWGQHLKLLQVTDASDEHNDDHLVLHVGLEKGRSWVLGKGRVGTGDLPDTLCYLLGGGMGQVGKINEGYRVGVALNAGCIHHASDNFRVQAELSVPYWYQGSQVQGRDSYFAPYATLGMQYDLTSRDALRLTGQVSKDNGDTGTDVRVQYLRYF
ncbi:MAG: DUF4105 domain-containing protein [Moraxella sp.]|nr:DUF4105 domain-containing protein [Moraxella sp.]